MAAARKRPTGHPSVRSTSCAASSALSGTCASEKICVAPATSRARSAAVISSASPEARRRGRCGCSARLAATTWDPRGIPARTTLSTSWQAGERISWRSSSISTNDVVPLRIAEASSGAARPSAETPCPPTSAARRSMPGATCAYADASRVRSAAGSSSNRSSDTHATGRSSACAHSAMSVDLPYPAGAVMPTTRRALDRADSKMSARLTEPRAGGSGTSNFASSRRRSSSTSDVTGVGASSNTLEAY